MEDASLTFSTDAGPGVSAIVNFGLFAGRDATRAELDRLADALLAHADPVTIVAEHRISVDRERRASIYQVRIEAPETGETARERIVVEADAWARDCIAERRLLSP